MLHAMSKAAILVPMPVSLHIRFKYRVAADQRSMSEVTRGLIQSYLAEEVDPAPYPMPREPRVRLVPSSSVIDEVAAKVHDAVDK